MFAIQVCGYAELADVIASFAPTHIISAINSIGPLDDVEHHLHVNVSDVPMPMDGHIHPTMAHLNQVLTFTAGLTDQDRLLVHCFAGQSRSTAYAIGVLIQHGLNSAEAFDKISILRSILLPNTLIIKLIDDRFGLHGELIEIIDHYRQGDYERMRELASSNRKTASPSKSDVAWMKKLLNGLQ